MKQLKDQLFKITQFVFDNEESLFCNFGYPSDSDLTNVFFSGSKVYIKYEDTLCGEQVKWLSTQEVFNWMQEEGFTL